MAGSYQHCTNEDGTFRNEDFTESIENLGDAHEACEHMHFMINYLTGGDKTKIEEASEAYFEAQRKYYNQS